VPAPVQVQSRITKPDGLASDGSNQQMQAPQEIQLIEFSFTTHGILLCLFVISFLLYSQFFYLHS
jgi:hypothetical protein